MICRELSLDTFDGDIGVWKSAPGKGRKTPKGRQIDDTALADVRALLGGRTRRRDLLIEFLHLIQDHYGHLSVAHLNALADEMRLAQTEVYEVASFYAHFDVVKDGEVPPPALTIRVCDSLSCELAGAQQLKSALEDGLDHTQVRVLRAPCMGRCDTAPVLEIGHNHIDFATLEKVEAAIDADDTHPRMPDYQELAAYQADGGYNRLKELRHNGNWEEVQGLISQSGLRGLGGAGFPSGKKWGFVRAAEGPRYLAVNGDEGEPGTFKDRYYLERMPHLFLEGMLIAAWAVEAKDIYIYLRDEYPGIREKILRELGKVKKMNIVDPETVIHLRRGAGAYICGEESAMIESIEGKKGLPRHKPPFISKVGLFGKPTLNHNIETVFWVRDIIEKGSEWYSSQGKKGSKGPHSYSVSGRVKNPGVKLAPAGTTMNELLYEYCGGMEDGHKFYGYLPGGASGGLLPSSMADIPLDFGTLEEYGCFIGSGAIVVFSDKDDITKVVLNLLKFFEDESCGQCTPCRVGTEKAVKLLEKNNWDKNLLEELIQIMGDASICGLGQAAGNPIKCALKYFGNDIS